jgi:hypothetical protein
MPARAAAQRPEGFRMGVQIGGTSLIALVLEQLDDTKSIELTVGTFSFKDLNVSLSGKTYLGAAALRPMLGVGVWVAVVPPQDQESSGAALVARVPVGLDWRVSPGHFLGMSINVNRALWVRRTDPADAPPNARLIPIPDLSYRWLP